MSRCTAGGPLTGAWCTRARGSPRCADNKTPLRSAACRPLAAYTGSRSPEKTKKSQAVSIPLAMILSEGYARTTTEPLEGARQWWLPCRCSTPPSTYLAVQLGVATLDALHLAAVLPHLLHRDRRPHHHRAAIVVRVVELCLQAPTTHPEGVRENGGYKPTHPCKATDTQGASNASTIEQKRPNRFQPPKPERNVSEPAGRAVR